MAGYVFIATNPFKKHIRKYKRNRSLLKELETKLQRIKINPSQVGKLLSGNLHGYRSTRILSNFRLVFRIDEKNKKIYLFSLSPRRKNYSKV